MEKNLNDLLWILADGSSFPPLLEELWSLPEKMQVSISEAARLTGISQAQIRNWTRSGILLSEGNKSADERTIRRYTLQDIRRLLIAAALKEASWSLSELAKLFQEPSVDQVIDRWLTSTTVEWNAESSISSSDQISRGLAQMLYLLALSSEIRPSTGLIIPIFTNSLPSTDSLQDLLPILEESLVIWATSQCRLAVFIQPMVRFKSMTYQLYPLLIPTPNGKPRTVYRLVGPNTPPLQVKKLGEGERTVILKLIPLLQGIVRNTLEKRLPFSDIPSQGPPALALLARMMKQLKSEHWSYVAVFLASRDPIPRYRQRLVLRAWAGESPFELDDSVPIDSGLVGWSYRAAQPANKETLPDLDGRVTSEERRGGMASLLASPIIAGPSVTLPYGVVLLGSREEGAFSSSDEITLFLLTNLLGGFLAQEEMAAYTHDYFLASLGQPPLKEKLFGPFKGLDRLTSDMTHQIREIRKGRSESPIGLLLVDVDRADGIEERYGYSMLREVTLQIGEIVVGQKGRAAGKLSSQGINLSPVSRTLIDRYAIFATGAPIKILCELGYSIMEALKLKSRTKVDALPIPVTVRVGIALLEAAEVRAARLMPEELTELIIGLARRTLAEGIDRGGNNVCYIKGLDGKCELWQPP